MKIKFFTRFFPFRTRATPTRRFEILLPLNYNDGAEVEPEKFDQTDAELTERFGGPTWYTVRITGTWKYGGTRYRDMLIRIRVDTTDKMAAVFFKEYKEILKERFRQIDIWITAHEIEVI